MAWRLSSAIWISTEASGLTWMRMKGSSSAVGAAALGADMDASALAGRSMWRRMRLRYAACCLLVSCKASAGRDE